MGHAGVLIPLPFVTALVCALLALRLAAARAMPRDARLAFGALAAICAVGSALVGLRFGYGVEWVAVLHRLVPLFLGPLLYLGFSAMEAPLGRGAVLRHLGLAVLAAAVFSAWVAPLDLVIAASYVAYWALIWRRHWAGPDALAALPMGVTEQMHRWRRGALVLLAAVCVLEAAIALSFALGFGAAVPRLIGLGSLPITGGLILAALNVPVGAAGAARGAAEGAAGGDLSDVEAYLAQSEAFRDPELSLARLARGVGLPIKSVSRRINAATGQSVSLYINGWRVEAAAEQLRATRDKVEVVGQDCGFLSRSNFYREFQRVHGQTPAAYRKESG